MDYQNDTVMIPKLSQMELNNRLLAVLKGKVDDAQHVQALIEAGANPNARFLDPGSTLTITPLMIAVKKKHIGIVKVLLPHLDEAAVNEDNFMYFSSNALRTASRYPNQEMVLALIKAGARVTMSELWVAHANKQYQHLLALGNAISPQIIYLEKFKNFLNGLRGEYVGYNDTPFVLAAYDRAKADFTNSLNRIAEALGTQNGNIGRTPVLLRLITEYAFPELQNQDYAKKMIQSTIDSLPLSVSDRATRTYYQARRTVKKVVKQAKTAANTYFFAPPSVLTFEDMTASQSNNKKRKLG